ncbi:hypothetical protein V6N11_010682 [Hibiscus sabdariffa]|uniref:Uncharacterized protein n=1 Tax=Hibiscus sabdariffa TaxID=183260 RepID=A0ABR2S5Z8_9ROSI
MNLMEGRRRTIRDYMMSKEDAYATLSEEIYELGNKIKSMQMSRAHIVSYKDREMNLMEGRRRTIRDYMMSKEDAYATLSEEIYELDNKIKSMQMSRAKQRVDVPTFSCENCGDNHISKMMFMQHFWKKFLNWTTRSNPCKCREQNKESMFLHSVVRIVATTTFIKTVHNSYGTILRGILILFLHAINSLGEIIILVFVETFQYENTLSQGTYIPRQGHYTPLQSQFNQ